MWYRLKRWMRAMGNTTDWLDGEGREPDWPARRPAVHLCEGCGLERPRDTFDAMDAIVAGQRVILVRCMECRALKVPSIPYDSREK